MPKRLATSKDLDCLPERLVRECYLLKFTTASGYPPVSCDSHAYPLPEGKEKGTWMKVKPPICMCVHGYHAIVASIFAVQEWENDRLFIVEVNGEVKVGSSSEWGRDDDKVVAEKMRFVREVPIVRYVNGTINAKATLRKARRIVKELNEAE